MTNRPTITDLARELGLSKSAVSNALRGVPLVSTDTAKRVQEFARERGWRPNAAARALSLSRSDNIGVVLVQTEPLLGAEPFYMKAIAGIERILSPNGKNLLLRTLESPDDELAVYDSWITEGRVDGVILFDVLVGDARPQLLDEQRLPYAVFGDSGQHSAEDLVIEEAQTIVEHLVLLQHTSILFLGGPSELAHEVERAAQIARMAEASAIRLTRASSEYSIEGGRRGVREALASHSFTAVVASSDLLAIGAATELRAHAEHEIALVSWDDSLLCQYSAMPLTALDRHPDVYGEIAARLLLNDAYSLDLDTMPHRPSQLSVRESSKPAAPVTS